MHRCMTLKWKLHCSRYAGLYDIHVYMYHANVDKNLVVSASDVSEGWCQLLVGALEALLVDLFSLLLSQILY